MEAVHFANLTRGLMCGSGATGFCRIQSTHCEQKQWRDIIYGAGPHLLLTLATHDVPIIVHDMSEKDRETRAMWQGLTFLTYACQRAWKLPLTPAIMRRRHGMDVTHYFKERYNKLTSSTIQYLDYYRQFMPEGKTSLSLVSCWSYLGPAHQEQWRKGGANAPESG